jgi:GNAT superfamily N-acetyltransferase
MTAVDGPVLRVVPIAEADVAAVAGLVNRAFATYSHIFPGQRTSPADYVEESGPDARVMLIEDAGRLLATAMIAPAERFISPHVLGPAGMAREAGPVSHPDPAHPWTGALYFGLAGVEPGLMNGGLGRRLVRAAEQIAASEGHGRVALSTVREFGLVEYYERLGYGVFHETEYPPGHWEFLVVHHHCEMVKAL